MSVMLGLLVTVGLGLMMVFMMRARVPSASIVWTLVAGIGLMAVTVGFVAVAAARRRR